MGIIFIFLLIVAAAVTFAKKQERMISGIHLQIIGIVIGLVTAYMIHANSVRQVNKLQKGHKEMFAELEQIKACK